MTKKVQAMKGPTQVEMECLDDLIKNVIEFVTNQKRGSKKTLVIGTASCLLLLFLS